MDVQWMFTTNSLGYNFSICIYFVPLDVHLVDLVASIFNNLAFQDLARPKRNSFGEYNVFVNQINLNQSCNKRWQFLYKYKVGVTVYF